MEEKKQETKKIPNAPLWKNVAMLVLIILIIGLVIYFLLTDKMVSDGVYRYEGKIDEGGRAVFKKGNEPTFSITYEQAKEACSKIGARLISMEDWGRLANKILEEGVLLNGNNNFGGAKEDGNETCEVIEKQGVPEGICLTGTGPSSWCYRGICDLNGNLAEWVDFPEVQDGIVNIEGKEYVLVPANYDMEKALGKDGVENLIPEELDPNPDTPSTSGASVMINKNSEDFNYPKTIPIKRDTILGDFDQFRNGNAKDYGDGKYYLWIPTYDKNNNKKEDGPADVASEVLVCDTFDGGAFTDCEHYRGCPLNANQIKDGQRMSSVIPHLIYPKIEYQGKKYDCPSIAEVTILHLSGFISGLREGEDLKDFALPSSISEVPSTEFDSDTFKIAPYGRRFAVRGGKFDDEIGSGLFNLEMIIDERNNGSWDITYRCVKDY